MAALRPSLFLVTAVSVVGPLLQMSDLPSGLLPTCAAAAVKRPTRLPNTLTFEMTTRFAAKDAQNATADNEQTVEAKVYVAGQRVRAESQLGDRPVVYLYTPPYSYKLLPTSKTGLRYRVSPSSLPGAAASLNPQALLPLLQNPGALRAALKQQGAQHIGSSQLGGMAADIYVSNNYKGKPLKVKAWLRHSDALPLRLEMVSKKLTVTASWHNYQRGRVLPTTLFALPGGYHIRDAQANNL